MMRSLEITEPIRDGLAAVARAQAFYVPGGMSASVVEIPMLALAQAVSEAYVVQARRTADRQARLDVLPTRAAQAVVEVSMRPKRRHRA